MICEFCNEVEATRLHKGRNVCLACLGDLLILESNKKPKRKKRKTRYDLEED